MKNVKLSKRSIALLVSGCSMAIAGATIYWQLSQPEACVRFTAGGQEVTYSRGCINPQRYKRWVVTS
jgi:ABC-type enterochelin transport system permease subunit